MRTKKIVNRRTALSTGAKVATAAVVTGVVGGIAGYLAGSARAAPREVTRTLERTVTVGQAGQTVTQTLTRTVTVGAQPPAEVRPELTVTFASPEWLPGRLTGVIAEGFTAWSKATVGKAVQVKMDLIPWDAIFDRLSTTLAAKSKEPTLLISDSQWLGQFYVGGHIRRLNDIIARAPERTFSSSRTASSTRR
jgi:ABC-type glycerol-3-phosphate transport system substrate-binding protein